MAGKRIADFDRYYASHGFVPLADEPLTPRDLALVEGLEKSVLFVLKPGDAHYDFYKKMHQDRGIEIPADGVLCSHGMIQEENGLWSSKNLGGGSFGEPVRVYVRDRS